MGAAGRPRLPQDPVADASDGEDEDAFLDRVLEIDADDAQYRELLRAPCYLDNRLPEHADSTQIMKHFRRIFDDAETRRSG